MKRFECNECGNQEPCIIRPKDSESIKKINGEWCEWCSGQNRCQWNEIDDGALPKLTAEALAERGIEWPEWAKCAATDSDGNSFFYELTPSISCFVAWIAHGNQELMPGKWDASDWRNSKIPRPKDDCKKQELPEWCKVGVRFEDSSGEHGEIFEIGPGGVGAKYDSNGHRFRTWEYVREEMQPEPKREERVPEFKEGDHVVVVDGKVPTHDREGTVCQKKPDDNGKIHVDFGHGWVGWYYPRQLKKAESANSDVPSFDGNSQTKYPDWCKVGAWVYKPVSDTDSRSGFGKIGEVGKAAFRVNYLDGRDEIFSFSADRVGQLSPARVRPWTFEEAPESVKIAESSEYRECCWHLNGIAKGEPSFFCWRDNFISASKMAEEMVQIDGSPCGVLEVMEESQS